jgi:hypothetical protein
MWMRTNEKELEQEVELWLNKIRDGDDSRENVQKALLLIKFKLDQLKKLCH